MLMLGQFESLTPVDLELSLVSESGSDIAFFENTANDYGVVYLL